MTTYEKVHHFNTVFLQPTPVEFKPASFRLMMMRVHLIGEETSELALGLSNRNPIQVIDALCDLEYVIQGTFVVCGLFSHGYQPVNSLGGEPHHNWNNVIRYLYQPLSNLPFFHSDADALVGYLNLMCSSVVTGVELLGITHETFLDAFDEVHRSNMSKLDHDGNPVLSPGGRVLKGPNYRKPELARFVSGININ